MKNTLIQGKSRAALLSAALLLGLSAVSQAALTYTVTLDVSSLVSSTDAPFALDLEMAAGSGNVANSVTLSNFQLVGGAFTGSADAGGSYSGSAATTLTLDNSSAYAYYALQFTSGTTLISFDVTQTTNSEFVNTGTPIPDQFNVFIDDANTSDGFVATSDPSGANSLLTSTIAAGETTQDIATYTSTSPAGVAVSVVPEPGSAALLVVGGLGLMTRRRRA